MLLKKIAFALLSILLTNFAIAQERSAVVEDINQRVLVSRPDFDQHVNESGTIVLYICADNPGDVTHIQLLRSKSTIKDLSTLSAVANEAVNLKFNAVKKALPQCGEMTFTFDKKTVGRKDIVATSQLGQNKVFGSRPMPPSTNVEVGDLNTRKILRRADMSELTEVKGDVVVYICADKYGRVIKAESVSNQSTIKNPDIISEIVLSIKRQMKFSPGKAMDCMYYTINIE